MDKEFGLNLQDVGDLIFRVTQLYIFREKKDPGIDTTIRSNELQEVFTLTQPDNKKLIVKIYPHKNFSGEPVLRIEVYLTKPGDMRGNRIAFMEALTRKNSVDEIKRFVKSYLGQLGL